jgi:hypothetical protein
MYNVTVFNSGRTIKKFDFVHDINGQGVIQYFDNEHDTVGFYRSFLSAHIVSLWVYKHFLTCLYQRKIKLVSKMESKDMYQFRQWWSILKGILCVLKKFDFVHDINGQGVIQYFDNEHDTVEFTITQAPSHGSANVTSDGTLHYNPDVNFYGVDFVIIEATETGLL